MGNQKEIPQIRKRRTRRKEPGAIRLTDVADRAGVSTATVSRVLNEPEKVSPALQKKVMNTVNELHWVPHAAAKALVMQETKTVGVITVGSLGHQNFAQELEVFQKRLWEAGYSVHLACCTSNEEMEIRQARRMIEAGVDALVFQGISHRPRLWQMLKAQKIPVIISRTTEDIVDFITVGYDGYKAFEQLTRHLLDLGHKRFGLMMITTEERERTGTLTPDERVKAEYDAVINTLKKNGINIRSEHLTNTYYGIKKGRACFRKIMSTKNPPTALVCMNDYMAIGSIIESQEMGIQVPGDVSITGFDDIELAAFIKPSLTTIRAPDKGMGITSAESILDCLQDKDYSIYRRELDTEFLLRDSTGPAQ